MGEIGSVYTKVKSLEIGLVYMRVKIGPVYTTVHRCRDKSGLDVSQKLR